MSARMKWCKTLMLVVGVLMLSLPAATQTRWGRPKSAGMEAMLAGDFAEAERQLSIALKEAERFKRDDPRLEETLFILGMVQVRQNKHVEAEALLVRALLTLDRPSGSPDPDSLVTALDLLGQAYSGQGKYVEAERAIRRALAADEKRTRELGGAGDRRILLEHLGDLAHAQRKYGEAESHYKEVIAMSPDPEYFSLGDITEKLADVYLAESKDDQAESVLRRVVAIKERWTDSFAPGTALNKLAGVFERRGERIEAEMLRKRAAPLLIEQGRIAVDIGEYAKALQLLMPLAEQGYPEAQNSIGVLYLEGWGVDHNVNTGLMWIRKAVDQRNAKAQFNYGQMYDRGTGVEKNFAEAASWYRKSAEQGYARGRPFWARCTRQETEWLKIGAKR